MHRFRLLAPVLFLGAILPVAAHATSTPPSRGEPFLAGFGRAVAVSGDWAFVGEAGGGRGGGAAGVVHVYRRLPTGWKEVSKLVSPTSSVDDGFGSSLAADGTTLMVGQFRAAPQGGGRGAAAAPVGPETVQVFRRGADGKWSSAGVLASPFGAGAEFGSAIALNGDLALVGAPGGSSGGDVAVYRRAQSGSWSQGGVLPATGLNAGDLFGSAIVLNGTRAAVGAPGVQGRGAVLVFNRAANGTWTAEGSPVASRRSPEGAAFGTSVLLAGDRLLVGAPGAAFQGVGAAAAPPGGRAGGAAAPAGAAALAPIAAAAAQLPSARLRPFLDSAMRVANIQVQLPADTAQLRSMVRQMAAAGGGAGGGRGRGGAANAMGMVVAFNRNAAGTWAEESTITPFDFPANARFGNALAMVGNDLWVGAPNADGAGRIYRVRLEKDGAWNGMNKLMVNEAAGGGGRGGPQFASSFAVSGDAAVVGMPGDAGGLGTVAFLGRSPTGSWTQRQTDYPPVADRFPAVSGKEVICGSNGMAASFQCGNTGLLAFMPISQLGGDRTSHMNDNWGWTDPLTGHEYALAGRTDGTSFVDITDPTHPRYLGNLPKTPGVPSGTWRDIKTYKNFAFIVADGSGAHGMQVFDLTRLRNVKAPQTFTEDAHYDRIASSHNIVINENTGFAYAVGVNGPAASPEGGETCGGGLHMIDIRDMKHPKFAGCFADGKTGRRGTGYSHDAVCITYHGPDTKYTGHEICVGANETAISIADVTDKAKPLSLSTISYPNVAYAHQGWFTEDHRYFYLDDESDEIAAQRDTTGTNMAAKGTRTMIYDLAKLDDPLLAKEYVGPVKSSDHNLYVKGNKLYEANYGSGLRIIDISDPLNPHEVAFLDTYPDDDNGPVMHGAWSNYPYFKSGTIIVTSVTEGLFLVKDRSQKIVP